MAQAEHLEYLFASRRLRAKFTYEEGVFACDATIFPLSIRRVDPTIVLQLLTAALIEDLEITSKGNLLRLEKKRCPHHSGAAVGNIPDSHTNGPTMFVATKLLRGNLFCSIRSRGPPNISVLDKVDKLKVMAKEIILSRDGLPTPLTLGDVNMTSAHGDYIVQAYCAMGNSFETKQARRVPIPAGVCFPTEGLLRVLGRGNIQPEAEAGDLCREFCLHGKCCQQGDRCTFLHVAAGAVKAFFGALSCERYPRLPNLSDVEFRTHIDCKCPYFHRTNKQSAPLSPWLSLPVAPDGRILIRQAPDGDPKCFAFTIGAVMGLCLSYYATRCDPSRTDQKGCDVFCCHLHHLEGKYGAMPKNIAGGNSDAGNEPSSESPLPPPPPAAAVPADDDVFQSMKNGAPPPPPLEITKRLGPPPPYIPPTAIDAGSALPKQPPPKRILKEIPLPLSKSLNQTEENSDRSGLGVSPVGEDRSPSRHAPPTVAVQQSWGDYDVFNVVPITEVAGPRGTSLAVAPATNARSDVNVPTAPPITAVRVATDDDVDDDSWLNSLQDRFQQQTAKPGTGSPLGASSPLAAPSPHTADQRAQVAQFAGANNPTGVQPVLNDSQLCAKVVKPVMQVVESPSVVAHSIPPKESLQQQFNLALPKLATAQLLEAIQLIDPIDVDDEIDDGETIPAEIADGIRSFLQQLGPTGKVLQKRYPLLVPQLTERNCSLHINGTPGSRVFLVAAQRVQRKEKISRSFLGFREDLQIPVVVEVYEDDVCQKLTRRLKVVKYRQSEVFFLPELKELAVNSMCHPGLLGYVCHELQATRDPVTRKSFHRISVVSEMYICTLHSLVEAWDQQRLPVSERLQFLRCIMKDLLDIVHDLHRVPNMHGAVMHHGLINWDTLVFDTKGKVRLLDPTILLTIDPSCSPSSPTETTSSGMTRDAFDLKCCAAIAVVILVGASNSGWYQTFCHSGVLPPVSSLTPTVSPGIDKHFAVAFDNFVSVLLQQTHSDPGQLLSKVRRHPFLWSLDEAMEFLGAVGYALEHSVLLERLRAKYAAAGQSDEPWSNKFLLTQLQEARLATSLPYSCSVLDLLKIVDNHRPRSGSSVKLPAESFFGHFPEFLCEVFKDVSQCIATTEDPRRDHGLGNILKFLVDE